MNSFCAALLLFGYMLPYISPSIFPKLSVLSLALPVLLVLNLAFLGYWLLRVKRQFLLSALVLMLGIHHITSLYKIGSPPSSTTEDFTVLSYNVRTFNHQGWVNREKVQSAIYEFIESEQPSIVSLQEYSDTGHPLKLNYPYKYKEMKPFKKSFGQIIFSKYPIINSGAFNFKGTGNNIIYTDIVVHKDTLRVYNVHLQSLKVSSQFTELQQEDSNRLLGRMGSAFQKQEQQVKVFLENENNCPYPVVVTGDFNNSATSYVYRKIKGEKEDAFAKAGSGTGHTFTFDFIPLRIDFILTDPEIEVTHYKNFSQEWSDHKPIKASFTLKKE